MPERDHRAEGGGSRLARPPEEVSLRDAVEAVQGPFEITHCICSNAPAAKAWSAKVAISARRAIDPFYANLMPTSNLLTVAYVTLATIP